MCSDGEALECLFAKGANGCRGGGAEIRGTVRSNGEASGVRICQSKRAKGTSTSGLARWVIGYCCLLFGPVQTGSGGYLLARKIRNMEMRGILVGLG